MATNDFLPFAVGSGANVLSQSAYAALTAITNGYSAGVAQSAALNKTWRQSSIMAAVLAQFVADQTGQNAVDDGTTATLLANLKAAVLASAGHGQCRLSAASATSLKLSPYNGSKLIINGIVQTIPSAGVTASNSGLTASTLYYVYAAMSGGVMTLNFATTTHVTGTNGVEVKSGDATQTLVGMIITNASSQFVDTPSSRSVLNWFNRRDLVATSSMTGATFSNGTLIEITSTARHGYLSWADEAVFIDIDGTVSNSTASAGATVFAVAIIDGPSAGPTVSAQTPYASTPAGIGVGFPVNVSEGSHYTSVAGGLVSSGASTATASLSLFTRTRG